MILSLLKFIESYFGYKYIAECALRPLTVKVAYIIIKMHEYLNEYSLQN